MFVNNASCFRFSRLGFHVHMKASRQADSRSSSSSSCCYVIVVVADMEPFSSIVRPRTNQHTQLMLQYLDSIQQEPVSKKNTGTKYYRVCSSIVVRGLLS